MFLFIDSPYKMSDFVIEENQNTAMSEVVAPNYLLSDQKECTEPQDKQDKLLGITKEVDFVTPKHEVKLSQKVVPKDEKNPQENTFLFQVGPYLSECRQYLLEYYDFSGVDDLVDIMKYLEHAGNIRVGVQLMLDDLRSHSLVKEDDLNRFDPVIIIALAHSLYYVDQDFDTEFYIRERISDYSDIYCSSGSIIINQNEESPGGTPLEKVEVKSKTAFLQEFWKYDNVYRFNLNVSLKVIWPEVRKDI